MAARSVPLSLCIPLGLIQGFITTGRLSAQGIALLSPDYRLLVPSTGHDVVEDIRDLFTYIENNLNSALAGVTEDPKQRIDTNTIAVAGSSAGGLCTYLSVMHVSPKPKALLSIYGQGGEFLVGCFLEFVPESCLNLNIERQPS